MENNSSLNKFYWFYLTGFFLILSLPIATIPPWFFPPDWGKTIVFRSILSILIFLFIFQFLYRKNEIQLPDIKKNKALWILIALFFVFLLATIFSVDSYFSLWGSPERSGGFINFTSYIIFAILLFFIVKNPDWQKILNFSIIIGILVSFVAIIQYYGLFNKIFISISDRPVSTLGNSDLLSIYILLLFFPTLFFSIKEKIIIKKLFYLFVVLLFFYIILIANSRAAYLGLFIGIIYFLLFYPVRSKTHQASGDVLYNKKSDEVYLKKNAVLKIISVILLFAAVFAVYYVNTNQQTPYYIGKHTTLNNIYTRLSLKQFLNDARFYAWKIAFVALKEKPVLGWGPENFAVAFDKYYDPSLPYINSRLSDWWDRAHGIFFDIGIQSGILGIIVYFTLFGYIFWKLQKLKSKNPHSITAHGVQATLIAYLAANIFSFDGFASYLIFFLLIGYSLYLISLSSVNPILTSVQNNVKNSSGNQLWKKSIIVFLFITLIIFLWQYNIKPLQINAKINIADSLVINGSCNNAVKIMESIMSKRSFLDAYSKMNYVDFMKKCANSYPENNFIYAKRGIEIMKEAIKIQPLFSRLWIFLGGFTNVEASIEKDPDKKIELINEANSYLEKANTLAPNHQETILEQIKNYMISGNYQNMKNKAQQCIALYPNVADCYWQKALSEIYLKEKDNAIKDIKIAEDKHFISTNVLSLNQLANAYAKAQNYKELALTYEKLIEIKPNIAQYHSSLAFTYKELGEYKKAQQEALIFLKLMPEAKDEVNMFLQTLPK